MMEIYIENISDTMSNEILALDNLSVNIAYETVTFANLCVIISKAVGETGWPSLDVMTPTNISVLLPSYKVVSSSFFTEMSSNKYENL